MCTVDSQTTEVNPFPVCISAFGITILDATPGCCQADECTAQKCSATIIANISGVDGYVCRVFITTPHYGGSTGAVTGDISVALDFDFAANCGAAAEPINFWQGSYLLGTVEVSCSDC